jgi:hypothetical protein
MEFTSQQQQDLEAYPMPAPPAQMHLQSQNQQHRPSLSLLSSLANGTSLSEALRMSRSSILIEPNGSWSFVSAPPPNGTNPVTNGHSNPFFSAAERPPPLPSIPLTYAEEARKSMASVQSSTTSSSLAHGQPQLGQMMPLSSHPVQMVSVPQGAYAQYQQHATPMQAQMQFHNAARELAAVQQQQQQQKQQQVPQPPQAVSQLQQTPQQPARMTPPPLFSSTHPIMNPSITSLRPSPSSRVSSAETILSSPSPSSSSGGSGAVLRPAMKRASRPVTAVLHDLPGSKQVSFVSSNRVSSMGFSTLVALADSVDELKSEQERESGERGLSL